MERSRLGYRFTKLQKFLISSKKINFIFLEWVEMKNVYISEAESDSVYATRATRCFILGDFIRGAE